jgi:hypothetical protein
MAVWAWTYRGPSVTIVWRSWRMRPSTAGAGCGGASVKDRTRPSPWPAESSQRRDSVRPDVVCSDKASAHQRLSSADEAMGTCERRSGDMPRGSRPSLTRRDVVHSPQLRSITGDPGWRTPRRRRDCAATVPGMRPRCGQAPKCRPGPARWEVGEEVRNALRQAGTSPLTWSRRPAGCDTPAASGRQASRRGSDSVLLRDDASFPRRHAGAPRGGRSSTRGLYSTSRMRPSKVRCSIISRATSG